MKTKVTATLSVIMISLQLALPGQDLSEWRGEGRTGKYPASNLLSSWSSEGPELLWMNVELPKGFSSMAFGQDLIFLTGIEDETDVLVALNGQGEIEWKTGFGRAWTDSFSDSRSTPTVDGKHVYVSSGMGDLACIEVRSGQIVWSVKASETYGGTYGQWGLAESLLIDQEKLYFTPGGSLTTTIALNKLTGELIWKSPSLDDPPAYVSPIIIEEAGKKYLINISASYIFSVDVVDGTMAWKISHLEINAEKSRTVWEDAPLIKCVSPLYNEGKVFITGGYDHGSIMLELSEGGDEASVLWTDSVLDVHHGGVILVDGYIYGSNWLNNGDGNWCCLDWETGKVMYEEHWKNKGSVIYADGLMYIYDEKRGHIGLVNANPDEFELISSFRVTEGSGPHWAHPAISEGKLFVRHGNALMAYNISK